MRDASLPWSREPWPWILMAGPAIVVVAGFATLAIAVKTDDGLVADDYYKQGLAINRVLARDEQARALGLSATVQFNDARDRVRVLLRGPLPPRPPRLRLVNATRAGEDRTVALAAVAPGVYEGALRIGPAGLWRVQLEDMGATWRLTGHWRESQPGVTLGAVPGKEGP
jgi:uncharacterized protein